MESRKVKLFRKGRDQVGCIPLEFELPGDEVIVHMRGEPLVIEPAEPRTTRAEDLSKLETIDDEEWPEIPDPPPEPIEL